MTTVDDYHRYPTPALVQSSLQEVSGQLQEFLVLQNRTSITMVLHIVMLLS
uniref:Uncharacterized protein n=1 Tax=Anguilla anguilla TaxID=7936 RepID=A0A0E9W355_ANGAN